MMQAVKNSTRVLHSITKYLSVSENWIYPQINSVPGIDSCVICNSVANRQAFPIRSGRLIVNPPPWNSRLGIPRLLNACGRRLGCGGAISRARIRLWRPHLIHAHFGTRGVDCLRLKSLVETPLITSFYGYDAWMLPQIAPVWRERYKQLFVKGDVFLVEGPAMCKRLIDLGCPPEKIRVHRIGVDLVTLPFISTQISSPLPIVMVGRFVEKKGLVDGLRACLEASLRGVDLTVTIVGDASPDDEVGNKIKNELSELASHPKLSGRVEFTGFLPMEETRRRIRAHQIFLCPSRRAHNGDAEGGSPVVLTEAMALGLVCIGTRHCDIPEVIINRETGYLCEEGDVSEMAGFICRLADGSSNTIALTTRGRQHVEKLFPLKGQLQQLGDLYRSVFLGL